MERSDLRETANEGAARTVQTMHAIASQRRWTVIISFQCSTSRAPVSNTHRAIKHGHSDRMTRAAIVVKSEIYASRNRT